MSDLTPWERCIEDALTECVWAGGKCFCITFMTQEFCHLAICAHCRCLMVITGFFQGAGENTPIPLQQLGLKKISWARIILQKSVCFTYTKSGVMAGDSEHKRAPCSRKESASHLSGLSKCDTSVKTRDRRPKCNLLRFSPPSQFMDLHGVSGKSCVKDAIWFCKQEGLKKGIPKRRQELMSSCRFKTQTFSYLIR